MHSLAFTLAATYFCCLPFAAVAQTDDRRPLLDVSSCPMLKEFPETARRLDPDMGTPSVTVRVAVTADGEPGLVTIKEKRVSRRLAIWLQRSLRACKFIPALSAGTPVPGNAIVSLAEVDETTLGDGKLKCDLSSFPRSADISSRGYVSMRVQTGADSRPREVTIEESSGSESLDRAAQRLAMDCKPTAKASPNEAIITKIYLQH